MTVATANYAPFRDDLEIVGLFWSKVSRPSMWACWEWQGSTMSNGYGQFCTRRYPPMRTRVAHRVAYELLVGPVDPNLALDHLCRNRRCVNPAHLEPVTVRENLIRGDGTVGKNSRKTHCKWGHEFTAENTYIDPRLGVRQCRACFKRRDIERAERNRLK